MLNLIKNNCMRIFWIFCLLILSTMGFSQDLVLFKGTVVNGETQQPLGANIKLLEQKSEELIGTYKANSETGKFLISMPAGKRYVVVFNVPNFFEVKEKFNCTKQKGYTEVIKEIEMLLPADKAVENIKKSDLKDVNFGDK